MPGGFSTIATVFCLGRSPCNPSVERCAAGSLMSLSRPAVERLMDVAVTLIAKAHQIGLSVSELAHIRPVCGRLNGDNVMNTSRTYDQSFLAATLAKRLTV